MEIFNLAKNFAANVHNTFSEDRQMFSEINRINEMCKAIEAQFNQVSREIDRDFEREHSEYLSLVERNNQQLENFAALSQILSQDDDTKKETVGGNIKNVAAEIGTGIEIGGKETLITGGIAGLGAGAGAVGVMTIFGTAGTGAALSSLTGVAYIKATLAAFGGGTIASGGLGILGGIAVLSATFLAPAAAVAGYIADKKIREAYEEALAREQKAKNFLPEGEEFLKRYAKGVSTFRYINRELYAFSNFFEELINMAVATPALQKTEQYLVILRRAAKTIVAYEQLNFINVDNTFNENIIKEIAAVKAETFQCQNEFYDYRAGLTPAHQKIIDELRQQKILNDKLQTEIDWQKNNQSQNYIVRNRTIRNEFNKALQIVTQELDIISAWVNDDVVDRNMEKTFETLLRRGVTIKILYGIGDMSPFTINDRNRRTNKVIARLKDIFRDYPNFRTKCTNTHEKLFICDEKFYVQSSMNILSFNAKYDGRDNRAESGEASNNLQLIREYRKALFNF